MIRKAGWTREGALFSEHDFPLEETEVTREDILEEADAPAEAEEEVGVSPGELTK